VGGKVVIINAWAKDAIQKIPQTGTINPDIPISQISKTYSQLYGTVTYEDGGKESFGLTIDERGNRIMIGEQAMSDAESVLNNLFAQIGVSIDLTLPPSGRVVTSATCNCYGLISDGNEENSYGLHYDHKSGNHIESIEGLTTEVIDELLGDTGSTVPDEETNPDEDERQILEFWNLNNTKIGINGLEFVASGTDQFVEDGKIGQGWFQDGTSTNYLTVSDPTLEPTTALAISFWYKRLDTANETIRYVFGYGSDDAFRVTVGKNFLNRYFVTIYSHSVSLQADSITHDLEYHHIVAAWEATGMLYLWLDNVLVTLSSDPISFAGVDSFRLCGLHSGSTPAKGTYDSVGIMHYIPTNEEVAYLWNSGNGREITV
jgi:hypothetical protein